MKNLVVIPTYNEIENIEKIIYAVFSLERAIEFEILIVDDSSPDGTATVVQKLQKSYPKKLHLLSRKEKNGLGPAYIAGFNWALERGYNYIMEMDADFSHSPADLPRLLDACTQQGAGLSIGSRYASGVNVVNWPMQRVLMSYFASKYVRFVMGMKIADCTAGFVCYTAETLKTILKKPIRFVGYAFQIEMKFKAFKYGFKIIEVPIVFTDRTAGQSKMSGSIFFEAFFGVLNMKISSYFNSYKR